MGIFGKIFGKSSSGDTASITDDDDDDVRLVTCSFCGDEVPEDEVDDEDGICDGCMEVGDTRYCCGMMYTDHEDACMSCGEPFRYHD